MEYQDIKDFIKGLERKILVCKSSICCCVDEPETCIRVEDGYSMGIPSDALKAILEEQLNKLTADLAKAIDIDKTLSKVFYGLQK